MDDFLGFNVGTLVIGGVIGYFIGRWHADSHRRDDEDRKRQAATSGVSRPLDYCERPNHEEAWRRSRGSEQAMLRMDCPDCIAEAKHAQP
jgi:hypothetical protein